MSQHYFNTTHEGFHAAIIMGWDRLMGHYFMIIERNPPDEMEDIDDDVDDEGCILYSNLNEPDAFSKDLAYFRKKLAEFGLQVPESMYGQIEHDCALKVGNRQVWYSVSGAFREVREDEAQHT